MYFVDLHIDDIMTESGILCKLKQKALSTIKYKKCKKKKPSKYVCFIY